MGAHIAGRDGSVAAAQTQITLLLNAVRNGDGKAAEQLWRTVYDELHVVAKARMARERCRGDIQTTVLVQEAYLRLVGSGDGAALPANRRHFFAAAANAMRQFLVDDARNRGRLKRGGGRVRRNLGETAADLEAAAVTLACNPAEILALDEALAALREHAPRKAEVVQFWYFAGLSSAETADVLGLSPRQVESDWRFAKAWLHRALGQP